MNTTDRHSGHHDDRASRGHSGRSDGHHSNPGARDGHHSNHPNQHDHDHHHGLGGTHTHTDGTLKALSIALAVTGTVFFAELIAGILSGSLALLSDAMHMLSDSTGLILALVASIIGQKAATNRATYGYRRVEVLAALINALTVAVVVLWIVWQAVRRLGSDQEIQTGMMMVVATIGLVANIISAAVLFRNQKNSLNVRGAFLHVLSDILGSVAVLVAGAIIYFFGWTPADTIASLLIAALVLPRAIQLMAAALSVLLEQAPSSVDVEEVRAALEGVHGVRHIHDLHVWTTDGVEPLATCHLVIDDALRVADCDILSAAQESLREFGIDHSTLQLEHEHHMEEEDPCEGTFHNG